ncbi:hypothetical protein FTZ03_11950 [Salmonella enterica]|nr:hypothetical protein [Salmonella enterica]
MHRIDTPTAQKDKFGQGKNGFTNGNPATGRRATDLNSDMWDAIQEEVCAVIEATGIPLSKGEHTQLHAAIGRLIDKQVKTRLEKDQNGADIPDKQKFIENVGLTETVEQARNAVPSTRKVNEKELTTDITLTPGDVGALPVTGGKLDGPLGIGTDNALGGNSIALGDNDTGIKWISDGVLGIYANNALVGYIDNSGLHMSVDVLTNGGIRAGDGKRLSLTSNNNSTMTATFNLWGDGGNRPTVIELDDDQGWHLYSQRNPDGSIVFTVNGDINANTLRAGGAIYQNNGDIFGSVWGNGWLSTWIHNNVVKAVRLGPVALSGGLWGDFQLGGGQVVTGFHTDGDWEMQGGDDKVYYRPIQYLVGDTWVTAPSV